MESYTPLLEKIRVPQPSLQKYAVISIFAKLRSAPKHLDSESEPGREAISQCLHSNSSAVIDQSVRELCRLVMDSQMDVSRGLLELQSALEGTDSRFVDLFVKSLGFLVRFGFQKNYVKWHSSLTEGHPFFKVLSCRSEVQSELVQQVLLLMASHKQLGMVEICEFLKPFLNYSILRIPFMDTASSSMFARHLISSMTSFCCLYPPESMPVFKLLTEALKYAPCKNSEESRNFIYFVECMVDAFVVVLRRWAEMGLLISEAQFCGLDLLEAILSICLLHQRHFGWIEPIAELSGRMLFAQKDLGLQYVHKLSSVVLSLFVILSQLELEHEQLSVLKLLHFLLKWKYGNEYIVGRTAHALHEELLLTFPVISLLSSTSKSVRGAAADLLIILEKLLLELFVAPRNKTTKEAGFPSLSSPGSIIFRLMQHQWFQDQHSLSGFFLCLSFDGKEMHNMPGSWASQLREYSLSIIDKQKSLLSLSVPQDTFASDIPSLLCAIAGVLLMHKSLGCEAVDSLAAIAIVDPKLGAHLLLVILFFSNIFTRKDVISHTMLLKLLGMLPALASHSMMIPLIVQTIMPMLQKDAKPTLHATAIRLLCQTWEINDRAFGSLQGVLLPKGFTEFKSERNICISMAASVRDVCRKNADRGVDLILSVSACIESRDPLIQALGFQSLACLCEADVIDFYTAWDVIAKHLLDYHAYSNLAHSICLLLRWGAMDAEAYPEASKNVLQMLWGICTSTRAGNKLEWAKARISALEALAQYEVSHIEQRIPDFKKKYTELLVSEKDLLIVRAMEELQVKIITFEHITRRRLVKEKRVAGSKIEKLLDVFPQVIFSSEKRGNATELPGAALLCLSFTPKDVNTQGTSKELRDVHAGYEKALVELAASLQLSRNVFLALISLQSWKSFLRRWLRADIMCLDAKAPSVILDKTTKAANDILKSMIRIAKDAIPRSAENIALAIGALCAVLPSSVHTVKSTSSKFLLSWLFQHEHEHRQWSAAISLGLISSCLHVTDHKQKFQNITGLLEVLSNGKSTLVKGACAVGLGFSCQDLLTRVDVADNPAMETETGKMSEADLVGKIIRAFLLIICQLTQSSSDIVENLSAYFPSSTYDTDLKMATELSRERLDDLEEDIWGVAGIVIGLASSIGAIYRAGANDAVLKIKGLIMSWVPHVNSLVQCSGSCLEGSQMLLSVGSCLALPVLVAFCQKVELMEVNEVDHLLNGYRMVISELVSVKKSGIFHQSLLMASCIGAGNLLACVLNDGVHSIEVESVKVMLELFRNCYCNPYPPLIHLGGMLGVVNAMGVDAGGLVHMHAPTTIPHSSYEQKESHYLNGPLLSSPVCEPQLTSLMQEIFLVAQNSDDHQLQHNAAWAVSFLRNHLFSKEVPKKDLTNETDMAGSRSVSQSISENSVVMKLSSWLMHLNISETGSISRIGTVAVVLRCLSQAPRLPALDWGAVIRRCMRYESQVAEQDLAFKTGALREECLKFSLAHASQFDPLLSFLDELSDLSRFRMLEPNLQSCLFVHLAEVIKVFSASRLEKLFNDVTVFLSSVSFNQVHDDQKTMLRNSCWKGICMCLDEASLDSLEYISHIEKCMEVLFSFLPALQSADGKGVDQRNFVEWSEAVRCLGKSRRSWLSNFLQVSKEDLLQKGDQLIEVLKKIQAKAKLVRNGSFPLTELGRLKSHLLNSRSHGIWGVLTEVVAALQHAEVAVRRQWLIDAVEISCVSTYPSTALKFLGLLSGSFCKYMPFLILDEHAVLSDLPVTLSSLLSDSNWGVIAESVVSFFLVSTERIHNWVRHVSWCVDVPLMQPIDESEKDMAVFLLHVMHRTCVSLKDYLPLDKQLKLANMVLA
ncbi:protein RST1 isoform X2 [Ziziphus jujuba]|uniref:Protein RST1 isoform X2 n=1 Tax=Ziziphus jujuba TaxID=326968 RepID=A0A6P3ZI01_ZIZJJ|nr:protein RST1 isoform X2 [Ziziphus jujuba]